MLKRRKKSLSEYSTGELVMFRFRKNKLAMFGVFLLAFVFLAVLPASSAAGRTPSSCGSWIS